MTKAIVFLGSSVQYLFLVPRGLQVIGTFLLKGVCCMTIRTLTICSILIDCHCVILQYDTIYCSFLFLFPNHVNVQHRSGILGRLQEIAEERSKQGEDSNRESKLTAFVGCQQSQLKKSSESVSKCIWRVFSLHTRTQDCSCLCFAWDCLTMSLQSQEPRPVNGSPASPGASQKEKVPPWTGWRVMMRAPSADRRKELGKEHKEQMKAFWDLWAWLGLGRLNAAWHCMDNFSAGETGQKNTRHFKRPSWTYRFFMFFFLYRSLNHNEEPTKSL